MVLDLEKSSEPPAHDAFTDKLIIQKDRILNKYICPVNVSILMITNIYLYMEKVIKIISAADGVICSSGLNNGCPHCHGEGGVEAMPKATEHPSMSACILAD